MSLKRKNYSAFGLGREVSTTINFHQVLKQISWSQVYLDTAFGSGEDLLFTSC